MSEEKKQLDVLYEEELERIKSDPALYMTPGARHYFRRVAIGYVILALSGVIGTWAITNKVNHDLRAQLNTFIVQSCKQSIPTLTKFNQGIQADIDQIQDNLFINIQRGDAQRVAANRAALAAKQGSKLHVPTLEECEDRRAF